MFSFAGIENCVKWHMDICLSVQNRQKRKGHFGTVNNAPKKNKCTFLRNDRGFRWNVQNEDKCIAFVLV